MKKIIVLLLILVFVCVFAEEKFIKRSDGIYRIIINENGDTLSFERIDVYEDYKDKEDIADEQAEIEHIAAEPVADEYDPQWLKSIVPYRWQVGAYGTVRGIFYGFGLGTSYLPDSINGNEFTMKNNLTLFSAFAMPTIMFLAPPLLLNENISPISIPIIDMGYWLGPMDYAAIRLTTTQSPELSKYDFGNAVLCGITESWGGYFLLQHLGDFNRAAGHFYAAGAFLGYTWGSMLGMYTANKMYAANTDSITIEQSLRQMNVGAGIALAYSLGLRSLGFYMGNNETLKWRSFDAWIIAANTLPGMMIAYDIIELTDMDIEGFLLVSGLGMLSSAATGYLIRDTHFDDANALLMLLGGGLGAMLGTGVNILFEDDRPTINAAGMVAGELAVYFLRKNSIGKEMFAQIPENINLGFYPTEKNGFGAALGFNF